MGVNEPCDLSGGHHWIRRHGSSKHSATMMAFLVISETGSVFYWSSFDSNSSFRPHEAMTERRPRGAGDLGESCGGFYRTSVDTSPYGKGNASFVYHPRRRHLARSQSARTFR